MPYIIKERRPLIDDTTLHNMHKVLESKGELNYALTRVILAYLKKHGNSYSTQNDIVGALDCAKAEFQRRVMGPYEDRKIEENGDIDGYTD